MSNFTFPQSFGEVGFLVGRTGIEKAAAKDQGSTKAVSGNSFSLYPVMQYEMMDASL